MKRRILLVDDDVETLDALKELLGKAGHETIAARDGEKAVALAIEEQPDLIVSDVVMPRMDGWQLCETLRTLPSTKTIPFIFLSSLHQVPEKVLALRLGADDYLEKPFDTGVLLMKVKLLTARIRGREELLEKGSAAAPSCSMENILVDTIEYLSNLGRTGVLTFRNGPFKGIVYIGKGKVKHVGYGDLKGEGALLHMLRLEEGRVEFKEGELPVMEENFTVAWPDFMASLCDRGEEVE